MVKSVSQNLIELINESFLATIFTRKIINTNWSHDYSLLTFRQNTSIITEKQLEKTLTNKLADIGIKEKDLVKA